MLMVTLVRPRLFCKHVVQLNDNRHLMLHQYKRLKLVALSRLSVSKLDILLERMQQVMRTAVQVHLLHPRHRRIICTQKHMLRNCVITAGLVCVLVVFAGSANAVSNYGGVEVVDVSEFNAKAEPTSVCVYVVKLSGFVINAFVMSVA